MKKTIYKSNHNTQNLIRKTIYVLLMLGMYSAGQAMIGVPTGGWEEVPIGSGGGSGLPPVSLVQPLTPPCTVSDNCNEEDKYMPVWRWNATTRTMDACPSPLFVRKDAYTCNKIIRISGASETIDITNPIDFNNPTQNSNCPLCNIGFVGINAIVPEEQLHVRGNVRCDDGMFMGNIQTSNIYGAVKNDPDGVPNTGDEEYGTIEVQSPMNFNNGLTAGNATIQDLSVSNLNVSALTAWNLNLPHLNVSQNAYMRRLSIGNLTNGIPKRPNGAFSNYALSVDGTIVATRSVVQITSWADKVFQKEYKLMSLSEIEAFVTQYKHLPEIPSEADVIENGIDVGEMNKLLLQKVEELTLHLIDLDKKYKSLEAQVKKTSK